MYFSKDLVTGKLFVNKSEKIFVFGNNKFRTHVDLLLAGHLSSVIGQKGESQNGRFKKTKHAKFPPKNEHFTRLRVGIRG